MMHVPEKYRVTEGQLATSSIDGNNGCFIINFGSDLLQCIASDGMGWEHVSITIRTKNRMVYKVPDWEIMCMIKDMFWENEDTVIQYHPKKSEYVNNHPYVLHLWKPIGRELPVPDSILVGIKF